MRIILLDSGIFMQLDPTVRFRAQCRTGKIDLMHFQFIHIHKSPLWFLCLQMNNEKFWAPLYNFDIIRESAHAPWERL